MPEQPPPPPPPDRTDHSAPDDPATPPRPGSPAGPRASTAPRDPTGTVTERLEQGEPRAPRPTRGHALDKPPEEPRQATHHLPHQGRSGASAQPSTTGGDQPTPRGEDSTPAPAADPPAVADPAPRQQLTDHDHGRWQVTTETSVYLLDLDQRWLLRIPGAGPHAESQATPVSTLRHDHQPMPLLQILRCEVGHRMWLLSEPEPDGTIGWRASTRVLNIRAHPQPRDARRRAHGGPCTEASHDEHP
jgi:hypothetical protein